MARGTVVLVAVLLTILVCFPAMHGSHTGSGDEDELIFNPVTRPLATILFKSTFVAYSDADHGGCKNSGRSTGAYVVKMGTGAISWSSKLQNIVALSTTEAEYVSAVSAGTEILWLRSLFTELGLDL